MDKFDYDKAKIELSELISWFESDSVSIDEATANYEKANQLIKDMQDYLKNAEAKLNLVHKSSKVSKR